jgi:hypothetical protein
MATPAPVAKRWAPRFAAPGEVIPIQVKVTRQRGKQNGFILKERLPNGWELVTTTPTTATVEAPGSVVKWLITKGADPVTVSYTARIPVTAPLRSQSNISGDVIFQLGGLNHTERTGGDDTIAIGAYHWADANGDGRIDDNEIMPAYYLCEEMKGFNLDWKTIEAIWSGKGYRWSPQQGYSVVK